MTTKLFAIHFDEVWEEAGYTSRSVAKQKLMKLQENQDFYIEISGVFSKEERLRDPIYFSETGYQKFKNLSK